MDVGEIARDRDAWKRYRAELAGAQPDLRGTNLEEAHLAGDFTGVRFDGAFLKHADLGAAQLDDASFTGARLRRAYLSGDAAAPSEFPRRRVTFQNAQMTDCNLRDADFTDADFTGADLRGAMFEGAVLTNANFTGAMLESARFDNAVLKYTIFAGAHFARTSFTAAHFEWTMLDAVDLTGALDLETVDHRAPSAVTLSTIYRSAGRVPPAFLVGTQQELPESVLITLRDALRTVPRDYRSCFVSYASSDAAFVDKLTMWLRRAGVVVWRDATSLQPGRDFAPDIDRAIVGAERFLVVLSAASLKSDWVLKEIERAVIKKKYDILPIRLDDTVLQDEDRLHLELRGHRHIANFSAWRNSKIFRQEFDLLLAALRRD